MWAMDLKDDVEEQGSDGPEMAGAGERVENDAFETDEMRLEPLPAVGR